MSTARTRACDKAHDLLTGRLSPPGRELERPLEGRPTRQTQSPDATSRTSTSIRAILPHLGHGTRGPAQGRGLLLDRDDDLALRVAACELLEALGGASRGTVSSTSTQSAPRSISPSSGRREGVARRQHDPVQAGTGRLACGLHDDEYRGRERRHSDDHRLPQRDPKGRSGGVQARHELSVGSQHGLHLRADLPSPGGR
jgi:hypothetical protein